jgi:hypothetical protein
MKKKNRRALHFIEVSAPGFYFIRDLVLSCFALDEEERCFFQPLRPIVRQAALQQARDKRIEASPLARNGATLHSFEFYPMHLIGAAKATVHCLHEACRVEQEAAACVRSGSTPGR